MEILYSYPVVSNLLNHLDYSSLCNLRLVNLNFLLMIDSWGKIEDKYKSYASRLLEDSDQYHLLTRSISLDDPKLLSYILNNCEFPNLDRFIIIINDFVCTDITLRCFKIIYRHIQVNDFLFASGFRRPDLIRYILNSSHYSQNIHESILISAVRMGLLHLVKVLIEEYHVDPTIVSAEDMIKCNEHYRYILMAYLNVSMNSPRLVSLAICHDCSDQVIQYLMDKCSYPELLLYSIRASQSSMLSLLEGDDRFKEYYPLAIKVATEENREMLRKILKSDKIPWFKRAFLKIRLFLK